MITKAPPVATGPQFAATVYSLSRKLRWNCIWAFFHDQLSEPKQGRCNRQFTAFSWTLKPHGCLSPIGPLEIYYMGAGRRLVRDFAREAQ